MTVLITGAGIIGTTTAKLLAELGTSTVLMDKSPHKAAVQSILQSARVPVETADIRDHEALCAIIDRHA